MRETDVDAVMDRVAQAAVDRLKSSMESAVEEADFVNRLRDLAKKVDAAQDRLNQSADTIRAINDRLQAMDAERIGQAVSYHTLKGIGEGFTRAAEARKPDAGN